MNGEKRQLSSKYIASDNSFLSIIAVWVCKIYNKSNPKRQTHLIYLVIFKHVHYKTWINIRERGTMKLRRKDREVTEIKELIQIIDQCKVCRIAIQTVPAFISCQWILVMLMKTISWYYFSIAQKTEEKLEHWKKTAMYALKWIVNTGSLQETQPANIRIHLKALSETVKSSLLMMPKKRKLPSLHWWNIKPEKTFHLMIKW